MDFTYMKETDSFGTEFATIDILADDGSVLAHFLSIPKEDGMTEEYVKEHIVELAEKFKVVPIVSSSERIDELQKTVALLADAIIHPITGTVSAWAALVRMGVKTLADVPASIRDAVEKLINSIAIR